MTSYLGIYHLPVVVNMKGFGLLVLYQQSNIMYHPFPESMTRCRVVGGLRL